MFDFANLLLAGRCNARCFFCIGGQIDPRLHPPNMNEYPPRGLAALIERIGSERIPQLVITGTNTDPQLYRYEARLLGDLRRNLPPGVKISLHTNGRLALARLETFNRYDRVCISIPSFDRGIYRRIMGVPGPPDLAEILRRAAVPLKVSCVLTNDNLPGIPAFLARLRDLGVRRVVLRKLYGERRSWEALIPALLGDPQQASGAASVLRTAEHYHGSPLYDLEGMQVTLWDFEQCTCRSLNLYSSGVIGEAYLLAAEKIRAPGRSESRLDLVG